VIYLKRTPEESYRPLINGCNPPFLPFRYVVLKLWLCTVYLQVIDWVGELDGEIFGLRLGHTDQTKWGPCFLVKSQIFSCLAQLHSVCRAWLSGKKPWGQLAPKFSDLVVSNSISVKSMKGYSLDWVKRNLVTFQWWPQRLQRWALSKSMLS